MASALGMNSCVHSVILPGWMWCHLQRAHEVKNNLIIWQTESRWELGRKTPQTSERSGRQTNTGRGRTKSTGPCKMNCVWKMTAGQNMREVDGYPNRCPLNDSVQPFWSTWLVKQDSFPLSSHMCVTVSLSNDTYNLDILKYRQRQQKHSQVCMWSHTAGRSRFGLHVEQKFDQQTLMTMWIQKRINFFSIRT